MSQTFKVLFGTIAFYAPVSKTIHALDPCITRHPYGLAGGITFRPQGDTLSGFLIRGEGGAVGEFSVRIAKI